ncbi:MAG: hypothetical protein AMK73_01910 [Planctomycetes bacterium SM23_32]|nr:MAG: hypothetical protein AMK73_01910 [Planctomycetes bacterium SM23_32]
MPSTTRTQRAAFAAGLIAGGVAVVLLVGAVRGWQYGPAEPLRAGAGLSLPERLPFGPGERLVYEFGWSGLPAAMLSVSLDASEDAADQLAIEYEMSTTPVVERLYRLESSGRTLLDRATLRSLSAESVTRKRDKEEATSIRFGADGGEVTIRKRRDGRVKHKSFGLGAARDAPAAFLLLRAAIEAGKGPVRLAVLSGESTYAVGVEQVARGQVEVAAGSFPAAEYELDIRKVADEGEPVREPERRYRKVRVWVAEEGRVPLRMQSEAAYGQVYAELVHCRPGRPD